MDTCVRSLSLVHHIGSLNSVDSRVDMNEKGRCRSGPQVDRFEEEIICPKPQRVALSCCATEFIKPVCQWQSSLRIADCEAGYEILEIFLKKGVCGDEEILNDGCSPPYCSPPRRASNPIVHDLRFGSQRSCLPTTYSKPKSKPVVHDTLFGSQRPCSPKPFSKSKSMTGSTIPTTPSLRIEGFDCSRMEMRHGVHA